MSGSAIVVGAGASGASVARELALRAWDVTLVEQYAPGTIRSASGGDTRLLRAAHAMLPERVQVRVGRRDVFFSGGDASWRGAPGFVEYDSGFYGHGDVGGLGVKIAPDFPSDEVDPDTLERLPLPERQRSARAFASRRFPQLDGAPVVGTRVCQYDLSPDTHFVLGRHPERASWWFHALGARSGHAGLRTAA